MKATGTLNAVAEYVEIDIRPEDNSVLAQITGTWVGTLVPMIQAETDGPWVECRWLDTDADAPSENTDANGNFQFLRVAGAQRARVYMSAYTSGEAVVSLRGSRGMGVQEPTPPTSGGATEATLQQVESAVDGVEALLTTIDGRVDGLEAQLTTIDGRVDGIEALLTTIDGRVDTLETLLAPLVPGGNFTDTTGTAGTPEQINGGNSQACRLVIVSNWSSSPIAVGFSNTVDVALKTGVQIPSGQSHPFVCTNTNQIWVDVTTNGDAYGGVWYT